MGWVGLFFVGVFPLHAKSDVRTDWLLFIVVMMTREVAGAIVLMAQSSLQTLSFFEMAFQSSSSLLVRPWLVMKVLSVHYCPCLGTDSRFLAVSLVFTAPVNVLDQVTIRLIHVGPVGSDMLHNTLLTLLSDRLPLQMYHMGGGGGGQLDRLELTCIGSVRGEICLQVGDVCTSEGLHFRQQSTWFGGHKHQSLVLKM